MAHIEHKREKRNKENKEEKHGDDKCNGGNWGEVSPTFGPSG